MAYSAYVLTEKSRSRLLQAFRPKFPDVITHHVTVRFGIPDDSPLPKPAKIWVVGYARDESLECVVVTIDGLIARGDGKTFHITLSLDRSKGRRPVDSNELLETEDFGPISVGEIFELETIPQIIK